MVETPPTAANMRFDGGHPALELVNTIYGQVGGPVEHDVLSTEDDLLTFAGRLGLAGPHTPPSSTALAAARELRAHLEAVLRAHVSGAAPPAEPVAAIQAAARKAYAAARLASEEGVLRWTWDGTDGRAPVHRLAHAAVELLTDEAELARLHQCAGCCWLFLDHSRGSGRRWCSMADCGTNAKKRRYVEKRRQRRAAGT